MSASEAVVPPVVDSQPADASTATPDTAPPAEKPQEAAPVILSLIFYPFFISLILIQGVCQSRRQS